MDARMVSRGLIPAAPIRQLIERWYARNTDYRELAGPSSIFLSNLTKVCDLTGQSQDFIFKILNGQKKAIGFDKADKIVISLSKFGADGWNEEPELKEIYDSFDFSVLDGRPAA